VFGCGPLFESRVAAGEMQQSISCLGVTAYKYTQFTGGWLSWVWPLAISQLGPGAVKGRRLPGVKLCFCLRTTARRTPRD
jgi:hypothetical protein